MKINHNEVHPYPAYQKSSLPWVEKIPQHWRITNVKRHFQVRIGKMLTTEPQTPTDVEVPYLKALNVQWNAVNINNVHTMWASQDEARQLEIRPGDLLVCEGGEGGRAAIVIDPPKGFIFQNALHRVRAKHGSLNPYLLRVMYGIASSGWFDALNNKATIAHFTKEKFEALVIPIPPLDEQAAIVRYLDHTDDLINRYISAKERLIALLEEQRQAVINQAVTRGLDPKVKLKPSSAHWLGNVPERWEMRRAKQLFNPRRELARPDDVQLSATQAYGVIPQDEYEQKVGRKVVKISLHLDKRHHVEVDDFVISMRSFQGGLERAWATGCIRSSYVVLHPTSEVNVVFFSYLFKSQAYIQALQSTANFIRDGQDLNFNNFCAVDLPVPPAAEQRETAMALGQATSNIDANIARTRHQIDLIIEYRIRLIADVVIGQIDVRNATVELPAEAR